LCAPTWRERWRRGDDEVEQSTTLRSIAAPHAQKQIRSHYSDFSPNI
jgi:hypothetical protein